VGERGFGVPAKFFFAVLISMDDAKLAPLGKVSNMQLRAAITEISFLGHNSINIQDK